MRQKLKTTINGTWHGHGVICFMSTRVCSGSSISTSFSGCRKHPGDLFSVSYRPAARMLNTWTQWRDGIGLTDASECIRMAGGVF
jgi:hypothetical protein